MGLEAVPRAFLHGNRLIENLQDMAFGVFEIDSVEDEPVDDVLFAFRQLPEI